MSNPGFRHLYERDGPEGYYRNHGDDYRNPSESAVVAAIHHAVLHWGSRICFSRVLDLAAGSGEATLALAALVSEAEIEGIDPFTHRLYEKRTGRRCAAISFEQIAQRSFCLSRYSCIVVSCALHLVGDSWLPPLCLALAEAAPDLLIITPMTRPDVRPEWGWRLVEQTRCAVEERDVRLRWYRAISSPPATS